MHRDILEDSWVYQEILEKGKSLGFEKGLTLGEQLGLMAIIQRRFPTIAHAARKQISGVTEILLLEGLIGEVSVAQTDQEVLELLSNVKSSGQMNGGQGESGTK